MNNQEEKKSSIATEEQTSGQAAAGKNGPVKKSFVKKGAGPNRKNDGKGGQKDEFDQKILDIARVTRVMAGGKRMSFRACVAVGDKKNKIGIGLGKGPDVALAVSKAVDRAKKDMVSVPIVNESTIPHEIKHKYGAAKILFKPSGQGRGIIAGGVVRIILELSGIKDITSKILGTNNKVNNAKCTLEALRNLKRVDSSKVEVSGQKKVEKKDEKDTSQSLKDEKEKSSQEELK